MKIIAGNFKSNLNRKTTNDYLCNLDDRLDSGNIYIFPATSSIVSNQYCHITIGAQNCYPAINGAFTGEITLEHLNEFNIKTILIGHSERRNILGEDDDMCAKKFQFFASHHFEIFFCIGENLQVRENNKTLDFLKNQISYIDTNYHKLVIAYEPIWAIGTGVNASLGQITEIYDFLKTLTNAPIIYGGSVNERNAKDILDITDGILVGSGSLDIDKFYQIIKE